SRRARARRGRAAGPRRSGYAAHVTPGPGPVCSSLWEDGHVSPAVPAHPLADGRTASSPLVRALRGERPERPPVWFPAGDPLPGTTADVERIVARTMAPVDAIGVDGVDLAVDLLTPARLAGAPIHDAEAVVDDPIRTGSDVLRLRPADPARLEPIARAAAIAVDAPGRPPLLAPALGADAHVRGPAHVGRAPELVRGRRGPVAARAGARRRVRRRAA